MIFAMFQLSFPIDMFMRWYFFNLTKRNGEIVSVLNLNEFLLVSMILYWYYDYFRFTKLEDDNYFTKGMFAEQLEGKSINQIFLMNIVYHSDFNGYRFDFVLACVAALIWFKCLLLFRVTKTFGPMFKIISIMIKDLLQFFVIWTIVILMFTCVAMLAFGELEAFQSFFDVFLIYFESCVGSWNLKIYQSPSIHLADQENKFVLEDEDSQTLVNKSWIEQFGKGYHVLFLIINLILFLNFVIAILSQTYTTYEDKRLGLYYEVVISKFSTYKYDPKYGFLVCTQPPGNALALPLSWLVLIIQHDVFIKKFNTFMSHILFLPVAAYQTIFFIVTNALFVPMAYFV